MSEGSKGGTGIPSPLWRGGSAHAPVTDPTRRGRVPRAPRQPPALVAPAPTRDHGGVTREPRKQPTCVRPGPARPGERPTAWLWVSGRGARPLPRPRLPGQPGPQPPGQPCRAGRRHLPSARGAGRGPAW